MLTIWIVWSTRDGVAWTREEPTVDPEERDDLVEQSRTLRRRVYMQVVHAATPTPSMMNREAT